MRNILAIFKDDLKKISHNYVAIIIMAGLIIIPSLYAWFNIVANWDPYANTGNIAIAVANNDTGVTIGTQSINAGKEVVNELKENHSMDWTFVDEETAKSGVKSGAYYAAVVIPSDFSKNMASILSGTITKPTINYYLNEKTNAIANKMTNVGVDTVQTKVNQAFVETVTRVAAQVLNVSADKLNEADPIDGLITNLNEVNGSLSDFKITVAAVKNAGSATQSMLGATKSMLPGVNALIADGQSLSGDSKNLINNGRALATRLNTSVEAIGEVVKTQSGAMTSQLTALVNATNLSGADAIAGLERVQAVNGKNMDITSQLTAILKGLKADVPALGTALDDAITRLDTIAEAQKSFDKDLSDAIQSITAAGNVSAGAMEQLLATNTAMEEDITDLAAALKGNVTPQVTATVNDVYNGLDDLSGVLTSVGSSVAGMDEALGAIGDALGSGNLALNNVEIIIDRTQAKISTIITGLGGIKSDARWGQLMNLMRVDPDTGASFISAPVGLKTTAYYTVENYGAAMTPFYTTLCLWVGALVLVAIVKTQIQNPEDYPNLKPWEAYFGRFLLFFCAAILQGLVACLGDLYILHVTMANPGLFIVVGVWTSVVYSLFIYTLTVAFDEVGKAIAVLIMVIQVAGSGGTFPIEVLPEFFRALNPFMAFTYSIGAMRECVAGLYANYYIMDLLKLLGYVAVSLIIGLVLRNPLIKLNIFFKEKLEDTGLM